MLDCQIMLFYLSASMLASAFLRATTGPGNFRSADQLELADDLLDRHLGALSPGAHDLRDAGLNGKTFFTADSLAFPDILPFPLLSRHRLSAEGVSRNPRRRRLWCGERSQAEVHLPL